MQTTENLLSNDVENDVLEFTMVLFIVSWQFHLAYWKGLLAIKAILTCTIIKVDVKSKTAVLTVLNHSSHFGWNFTYIVILQAHDT